ncbi:hypothetical protein MPC4_170102 [Methylocella tundrae]|uniref:Uncharacterized protein n=1 Tax=Methylocella tundrae TaxID=227605 RepID=A0A8B6M3E7_METTU|nr:hypothetical protein MPC4_170102 [Methylocella tundrae]
MERLQAEQEKGHPSNLLAKMRRGGRVVEGARLESVYAGNRIAGSNPAPSASLPFLTVCLARKSSIVQSIKGLFVFASVF